MRWVPSESRSILFIRLAVGLIFLSQGILKYIDPNMGVLRFTKIGFSYPGFTAPAAGRHRRRAVHAGAPVYDCNLHRLCATRRNGSTSRDAGNFLAGIFLCRDQRAFVAQTAGVLHSRPYSRRNQRGLFGADGGSHLAADPLCSRGLAHICVGSREPFPAVALQKN